MALTKVSSEVIESGAITTDLISVDVSLGVKISNVSIANSSYTILDDTAANTAGGYIVLTGAGFKSGAIVTIGDTNATTTTFVNSTTLRAQVPAKDAGTYPVYVTNTDGSVGLRINGLTYSNTPVWGTSSTLDSQTVDTAFGVNLSANSDSSVTYANTTALPAGTDLLSNGYFYGTVTGIAEETTYTFTVEATDAENQENSREFSVTVLTGNPWDLSYLDVNTYLYTGLISIFDSMSNGTRMNDDGTLLIEGTSSKICSFPLSVAYNVASVGSETSKTLSGLTITGIEVKPDGTKLFLVENSDVYAPTFKEYSMSPAWDISTLSLTTSISIPIYQPQDLYMTPDGTKAFISYSNPDQVKVYTLSTPWDLSTATNSANINIGHLSNFAHFFKPDGTKYYTGGTNGNDIYGIFEYTLSTPWDLTSRTLTHTFNFATDLYGAGSDRPTSLFFKPDGTRFYFRSYQNPNRGVQQIDIS